MHHCPYCGTNVRDNEFFCIKCGKELPEDMHERMKHHKTFNKYWYLPAAILALIVLGSGIYYIVLQNEVAEARELYKQAEESTMAGQYQEAGDLLQMSLNYRNDFSQAENALSFVQIAKEINTDMEEALTLLDNQEFQNAIDLINTSENKLNHYNGDAVTELINSLNENRNIINLEQVKYKLNQDPDINDLKTLLWEADDIQSDEANSITANIRKQIIDYTYSKASEQLNANQFSDAILVVDDGLKYAPDSEKLQSLKTTIDKEKTAFETAQQQRIEQAINSAQQERKLNENDAIELISADVESNEQEQLVIKGNVKSVATVPIDSILIEYSLDTGDEAFLSNEVYVYPDTLYPGDVGEFEFTHFDIDQQEGVNITIDKIKWYTDQ